MSTEIDQRVVEMRFDNRHFESNVQTTMSTLDKLKQKLNLSGSAKGLEGISSAAKKVDMSGLSTGIDTVHAKFSALQVMGVTALANITNSAVNAGKRMVSALAIDPIKSGFQEYETQINSVQTILANTQKEGTNVETVNKALDELNTYADKTIYNFTEMTRNIGTFTAAGVKLQTSVDAIQGIANLAAVSGSTSQQASTAMYQLSQALASGTVKLMDWNSVVNAGMGGQVFQDALKETSELLGTGAEAAIKAEGSFRDSLTTGWLTSEVLTETLKKFTTSGANEYVAKYTGLSEKAVQAALKEAEARYGEADAIEYASKALAEKSGKNAKEIKDALQFAKNAEDAATKVKTFTQLWDVLKEAAQSGWGQTWRLIVGDFEEAKNLITPLADKLTGIINKFSEARNKLLESALGKSFTGLTDKISGLLKPAKQAIDTVKEVKSTISDLGGIVDDVILGKFGNGKERFDALTKAGENYYRIQNKVNEKLGDSFRYTDEQIEAQDKLLGKQKETTESKSEESKETAKLTDEEKKRIKTLAAMSDEQLRSKGYTDEQIAAFKELRDTADKLGLPLNKFIDNLDEINGRWLLLNSFKNIGTALSKIFSSIGQAWKEIFDPINSDQIFNVIAAFHKFTASLVMNKDTADALKRTFKGLFAIVDIIRTVVGGGLKIAFNILSKILGAFDMNVLDLTANIGDIIVKFRDWLLENNLVIKAVDKIIEKIPGAIKVIKEWVKAFLDLPIVQKAIDGIKDGLTSFKEIGKNIIEGLKNGLSGGIDSVLSMMKELGRKLINAIKGVLGIHSPSTEFFEIGRNIIEGLVNGIAYAVSGLWKLLKLIGNKIIDSIKSIDFENIKNKGKNGLEGVVDFFGKIFSKLKDVFSEIDLQKVFAAAISVGTIMSIKKFADAINTIGTALSAISKPLSGLGDMFTNIGNAVAKLSKSLSTRLKAAALKDVAISIAILVGSIIALTFIKPDKLWEAVYVVAALASILLILAAATELMAKASTTIGTSGARSVNLKAGLLAICGSLLILALTVKIIGSLNPEQAEQGFNGLISLLIAVGAALVVYTALSRFTGSGSIDKVGGMLLKLSLSLIILIAVIKLVSKLTEDEIIKGTAFLLGFSVFVGILIRVTQYAGRHINKVGGMLIKLSIAMLLLVGVVKLASKLSPEEMAKGALFAAGFTAFVWALVAIAKSSTQEMPKIGRMLIAMATSMLIMTAVVKIIGGLSISEIIKGGAAVLAFTGIIYLMVKMVKSVGPDVPKMALTLIAMSLAIGILAGISIMLSLMDPFGLVKGIIAVGALGAVMALMIRATRKARECKSNLIVMTVAIGVMTASVAALSMIDTKKLLISVGALSLLMGMFAVMTVAANFAKASVGSLIVMTGVILVMAGIIHLLSKLDPNIALSNAIALSALMVALSASLLLLKATSSFSSSALKGVISLTAMAIPLLAFVGILALMNKVQNATENVKALVILAGALTLLLIPLTIIGNFIVSALLGVLSLTAMAIPLLAFVGVLALMNKVQNATTNAELLIGLMTAISDVLFKISLVAPLAAIGVASMAALTGLMIAIGGLAIGLGALMDKFPSVKKFIETGIPMLEELAYGIGSMLGNFIVGFSEQVMQLLPKFGECLSEFMENVTPFIDKVKNIGEDTLVGVGYLSGAILALTAANFISAIGQFRSFGQSYEELGASLAAFASAIIPFIDTVKDLDEKDIKGIDVMSSAVKKLATAELTTTITGLLQKIPGASDLDDFGDRIKKVGECLKDMAESVKDIDTDAVSKVAGAIKNLAEAEAALPRQDGWLQDRIGTKDIGEFGERIKKLGECLQDMNTSIKGVDMSALAQLAEAIKGLVDIENALPRQDGWLQDKIGTKDIGDFGKRIKKLVECLSEMNSDAEAINTDAVSKVAPAIEKLVALENKLPRQDGWLQDAIGTQDIGDFGERIKALGTALTNFSANTEIDEDLIAKANNSGTIINDLQKALPKEGWFDGKMDLEEFSEYIEDFGEALSSFSKKVSDIKTDAIDFSISSAYRIKNLINDLSDTDISGIENFTGIGKGGAGVSGGAVDNIARALSGYCEEIADMKTSKLDESISAAYRLKNLINALSGVDIGGLKNFKIVSIAEQMKAYGDKVSGIESGTVTNTVDAAIKLKNLISSLAGIDISGITKFGYISNIGSYIKQYASTVNGVNYFSVLTSISVANKIAQFINGLSGINTGGVSSFKTAVNNLSTVNIGGITKAFDGASSKLTNTGSNIMNSIIKGMKSKQGLLTSTSTSIIAAVYKNLNGKLSTFTNVGKSMISNILKGISESKSKISSLLVSSVLSAISRIRGYYDGFYSAGSYLVSGFANGISANAYKATAKAVAMANAAKKAVEGALDINSPSKVFYKIGNFTGMGFVNALNDYSDKTYNAAYGIGDYAKDGLSKAISKINSIVNNDIDSQPTIRPVLDLSDIESGAGTIGNMFNRQLSIGAVADVNSISSMMNQRSQNGINTEIVSAINKLRNDLGKTKGDTYNVNGITYDDGSNISDAVKSIVRAARIERRV